MSRAELSQKHHCKNCPEFQLAIKNLDTTLQTLYTCKRFAGGGSNEKVSGRVSLLYNSSVKYSQGVYT